MAEQTFPGRGQRTRQTHMDEHPGRRAGQTSQQVIGALSAWPECAQAAQAGKEAAPPAGPGQGRGAHPWGVSLWRGTVIHCDLRRPGLGQELPRPQLQALQCSSVPVLLAWRQWQVLQVEGPAPETAPLYMLVASSWLSFMRLTHRL